MKSTFDQYLGCMLGLAMGDAGFKAHPPWSGLAARRALGLPGGLVWQWGGNARTGAGPVLCA